MRKLRRVGGQTIFRLLAIAIGCLAVPAMAQGAPDNPYDTSRPEYAVLAPLEDRATSLVAGVRQDAQSRQATISAWRALQEAAAQIKLPNGDPHPLYFAARLKIASQLYTLGENAAALAELETGTTGLKPYQEFYQLTWAEGLALLGVLMTQDGKGDAAWPIVLSGYNDFLATYDPAESGEESNGTAMAKSNLEFALSQIASRTGRAAESIAFQKTSLETRESALGPNHPDTIASYYGYAGTLRRAGENEEAERYARTAVERAVDHVDPSHPSYARALEMLGIVLSRSGRPIEATDYLVSALELKREHEGTDNLVFGYGIHNLATILLQRQNYDDASPLFIEAEALFRAKQGENSPYAVGSMAYAGQIDYAQGRPSDAIARFGELETRLGDGSSDVDMRRRIAPEYIRSLLATGDSARAKTMGSDYLDDIVETEQPDAFMLRFAATLSARAEMDDGPALKIAAAEQARSLVTLLERRGIAELRGAVPTEERNALDLAMEIAVLADDADLMLSAMSLLNASDIAVASAQRNRRTIEEDPRSAKALRDLQDAESAIERADTALLKSLLAGTGTGQARNELADAVTRRAAAMAELAADFPGQLSARKTTREATIADLARSLAPDEAMLAVMPGYASTYVLFVDNDGALVSIAGESRKRIEQFAREVRADAVTGRDGSASSRSLSNAIISPAIRARLGQTQAMRIVAGGTLAALPFALLPWDDETDDQDLLIDRFALANATTFEVGVRPPDQGREAKRFAGFADPMPFGTALDTVSNVQSVRGIAPFFNRDGPDVEALSRLPSLARSRAEVRDVAALFAADRRAVFIGRDASESAVSSETIANADVLLFATHGLIAGEIEGIAEPALVMSAPGQGSADDGLLTASEVATLDLKAEWVILSACDSAAGMQGGMPAFSGLAQAFRFAGADALLVTHWEVRDDVAAFVTRETLRRWRSHGDKRRALRESLRSLRTESGLPDADNPAVWGPFVLIESLADR